MVFHLRSIQLVFALLCWLSRGVFADTFLILDQNGTPIKGAVIELTEVEGSSPIVDKNQPVVMDQINKQFVPELLVIKANDDVSFPNSDNIRHHVYSFSPAKPFELKLYSGQPNDPLTFEKPGIVVLGCNIHDSMVGYIYVAKTEYVEVTNDEGLAFIDPNLIYQSVKVWHPYQSGGHMTVTIVQRDNLTPSGDGNQVFEIALSLQAPEPRKTLHNVLEYDH